MDNTIRTADQLAPGEAGRIVRLTGPAPVARRLTALGLFPGAVLRRRYTAPAGSPIAFEAGGALLALRVKQARQIAVQALDPPWTE